jgi:hypothetical protein
MKTLTTALGVASALAALCTSMTEAQAPAPRRKRRLPTLSR